MDKAAVFIDQGYLYKILEFYGVQNTVRSSDGRAKFENKLDYVQFSEELCRRHTAERFRTYVYDALPYRNQMPSIWENSLYSEKQKFKSYLDAQPSCMTRYGICMRVSNKSCQLRPPCQHISQKGVDVRFTIDLVSLAADKRIDKAILVTGDSDFIPAIEYARNQNMKIILYYMYSEKAEILLRTGLKYACDEKCEIDNDLLLKCIL